MTTGVGERKRGGGVVGVARDAESERDVGRRRIYVDVADEEIRSEAHAVAVLIGVRLVLCVTGERRVDLTCLRCTLRSRPRRPLRCRSPCNRRSGGEEASEGYQRLAAAVRVGRHVEGRHRGVAAVSSTAELLRRTANASRVQNLREQRHPPKPLP